MQHIEGVTSPADIHLGIGLSEGEVRIASSTGQLSSISTERLQEPDEWLELTTYGVPLPDPHRLLACAAVASGTSREHQDALILAARSAGWDGLLVVSGVLAAGRALRARAYQEDDELALVVVAPGVSSVGIVGGSPPRLLGDDPVRSIGGREARELAVSLRCLLKRRPRGQVRDLLRRVLVVGERREVERVGRHLFVRELEGLGAREVIFELDPFLIARGALLLAQDTGPQTWRRLRRRWR